MLSRFQGRKIEVECPACGMVRQYDGDAMIHRVRETLGMRDITMPHLLSVIARAEGCSRVENTWYDRCGLIYSPGSRLS
jgi:hypothetical protein